MKDFWGTLDTTLLVALIGLCLEFYRQWLKSRDKQEQEIQRQIKEAKDSSRERTEIKKDLGFIKEKVAFVLDWMSANSGFRS